MYVIHLRFSSNKGDAPTHMSAHNEWVQSGIERGLFALVGSIRGGGGGTILASNVAEDELEAFVALDPFVANDVVRAEILAIDANHVDPRLGFLTT